MITNKNCRFSKEGIFLRLLIAALISFGAVIARAAGERIPAGYTEIEYIQGNGWNTRIVTDYTPQPNTDKIEAVVEWPGNTLAANVNQAVWCARGNGTQVDSWTLFVLGTQFRFDYMPNGHAVSLTPNFTISTGTKYTITAENNTVTYSANGSVLETQSTPAYSYTAGSVLALFASHYSGINANVGNWGKQKLYSFKVWRSGKLIHYFVPCKDSGGAATMVDICDNPATLSRSGTFTAGSEGHYFDDSLITIPDDTLVIVGTPGNYGSPSPAYGKQTGLIAGGTVSASCGAAVLTNGTTECIYQGWKLYDAVGNFLTNGTETSFTYTHPTPAKGRKLEWQWKTRPVGADATDLLPTLCMTFNSKSLANTGTGTLTMKDKGTETYVPSADGYALNASVYTPWGDNVSNVITANRDSSIAVVAALGTTSCGILVHFRNSSNNAGIVLRRGTVANQVVLTQGNSTKELITVNDIENADIDYHLYVANILASGVELYIDGERVGTTASTPRANAMNSMQIGSRHGNVISPEATYGGGLIDDVRVYASALSTEQMKALMDAIIPGKEGQLMVTAAPEKIGSPSPAYGRRSGLEAGETVAVSCGAAVATNDEDRVYACAGWKLYDENGNVVSNGLEASFTYTHPTPAAYRELEWQWREPFVILPIPDQTYNFGDICRPELTVSNVINAATWTIGGDIVSEDFDVEYANNAGAGVASVTVTGTGAYPGATASATFNISATALEDANLSTTDNAARRIEVDGKYVYIFTNAASAASVKLKRNLVLTDALLVGGGGAGGNTMAGGGGAGGFIELAGVYARCDVGDEITFTVGAGGAVATGQNRGGNGGDTIFTLGETTHTAKGGGGGGGWSSAVGSSGGSGGGSTRGNSVGLGVEGQGYAGARAAKGATSSTGGGGGAGESGHGPTTSPARSGDGGAGRLFAITGEYYGGGGGGGGSVKEYGTALAGSGGLGGGGDGGRDTGGADGADGYGGGGGGGGYNGANQFGGKGGSGTVILVFRQTDLGVNPIPDQSLDEGGVCRPSFTVVNTRTSQSWTVGGDSESPNFDVEYTNNTAIGVAGVTLIGKGVYAGERFYTTFRIISDSNIATDDLTVRTFTTGGRTVYVFKNAALGRTTVTARRGLFLADALLVGGGGAGGNTMGAGGGGGGVLQLNGVNAVYKPNDTFSLTVGAGGVISATAGYRGSSGSKTSLEFGVSSGMNAVIVAGGGAGGAWSTNPGLKGASGGGGCKTAAGGAGTEGLGFAGAAGSGDGKSGGGGGAGQVGSSADTAAKVAGAGGNGVLSSITGEDVYYGGGGGAGGSDRDYGTYAPGTGGLGGGGKGGKELHGANGVDGLGGGGGGGGYNGVIQANGGNGGAGTVILSFTAADLAIDPVPSQVLAAGGACPEPVVRLAGDSTVLTKGVDYEVSYSGNDALGTALMTVTGIGTYAGKVGYATFLVVERYYAKPSVDEEGDGLSWETAMSVTNFFAKYGIVNNPCEVWIAAGTVSAQAFSITNNASLIIRGGFAGTETSLDERAEGALTVFDGENTAKCLLKALTGKNAELTLDQIKFYRAKENGFIKTGTGSLKVVDCVIEGNGKDADRIFGRGMNVSGGGLGSLVVSNCVFKGNQRRSGIYTYGGFGLYVNNFSTALVDDSLFITNGYAIAAAGAGGNVGADGGFGGAMRAIDTPVTVRRCRFAGNVSPLWKNYDSGGVLALTGACGGSVIDHCVFIGNTDRGTGQMAGDINTGGALAVRLSSATDKVKVTNCTFAYNIAHGHYSAGGISVAIGSVDIDNSVFWKNTRARVTTAGYGSDVQVSSGSTASIRNSLVTTLDGTALAGAGLTVDETSVFAADPKLVTTTADFTNLLTVTSSLIYYNPSKTGIYESLAAMDAHLLSPAGYVVNGGAAGPATTDYSPAIDLGDIAADYSNEPAPNGGRLNLGAFGNTAEASCTAVGQPEANVEVTFPDGMTRPKVTITMGLKSGDAYAATVQLYCTTGGVLLSSQIWLNVGNGEVLEFALPYYLTNGDDFSVMVMINAPDASPVQYQASETVDGEYPDFNGKGGGANVIHVRTGANCKMDGSSWTDAYPDLATAFASAPDASKTEVWLAVSKDYMPRQVTLTSSLTIRGGFSGVENSADERTEGEMTQLDGGNIYRTMNFSVGSGATLAIERIRFSHSVNSELNKAGAGNLTVRDCWFTDSVQSGSFSGRGISASGGIVSVSNCKFTNLIGSNDNGASYGGNGIYLDSCAAAYIDNCLFVTNGMASFGGTKVWQARHKAAGVWVNGTPTILRNCRFAAHMAAMHGASGEGGTVFFSGASGGSKLINCSLVGNSDTQGSQSGGDIVEAGAIVCAMSTTDATLDIENCTVAYNLTQGQVTAAGITITKGTVNVKNSIFYGNFRGLTNIAERAGADFEVKANGYLNLSYSLVTGLTSNYIHAVNSDNLTIGAGVISDVDPLLATTTNDFRNLLDASGSYLYLPSSVRSTCAALDVHPRTRTGYFNQDGVLIRDSERVESPTIDAGDPASDYTNEPIIPRVGDNGGRVNLGAYGNTPEAALTKRLGMVLYLR